MNNIVIMVAGKSHSGKGTLSVELESNLKQLNYNVIRCSLSTYIRRITEEDFFCEDMESLNARKFMAEVYRLGTTLLYPFHKGRRMWERDVIPYLNKQMTNIIIVESFRELNDYTFFSSKLQGNEVSKIITINVVRPNFNILNEELNNHISERDLDNYTFDYEVVNDKNIEDLNEKIKNLTTNILSEIQPYLIKVKSEPLEDLQVGNKVKVIKITNPNKAEHLERFIGQEGYIFSWIINGEKKYKVAFIDNEILTETAYFKREELQFIER